jgi:hypothetical protein
MKTVNTFFGKYLALALALFAAVSLPARAADHGDAPAVAQDQGADLNDVYLFLDPNDNTRVVFIMTTHGFIAPAEAGNFGIFDRALRYRFEIERTGDARPDAFLDFTFNRRLSAAVGQIATVTCSGFANNASFTAPVTNAVPTADVAPPQIVTENAATGIRVFAGLTDDPFFFDIPAFGRFIGDRRAGVPLGQAAARFSRGRDSFAGYDTMAIAVSLPVSLVRGATNELGLSAVTQRRNPETYNQRTSQIEGFGRWVNIDRNGVPAVNVALVPFNSKDEYNAANTLDDAAGRFAAGIVSTLQFINPDIPTANINLLAGLAVARGDILRLNLTTANSGPGGGNNAGAGFPNGRRLQDDVIDVELQVISNVPGVTDNANANDVPFSNNFPFIAPSQQPRASGVDDNTRN